MIVGNIVNCSEEVDEKYFNCFSIEDYTFSTMLGGHPCHSLPTLIIGWSNVKEYYPNTNILSKVITEPENNLGGVYWTFSKSEKRGIYENNLKEFKERCYIDLVKGIKTYNIDPIIYNINSDVELYDKLVNLRDCIGYLFQERVVYIYKDNAIFMIDLELMDFIGFNKDDIIKFFVDNLSVFDADLEEKYVEELKHLEIKYIPYLEYKNAT